MRLVNKQLYNFKLYQKKERKLFNKICSKGFGLKLAKLRLKTPFKTFLKSEQQLCIHERFLREWTSNI